MAPYLFNQEESMKLEGSSTPLPTDYCNYPNAFSDGLAPAVRELLPEQGSLSSKAIDHTTKIPTLLDTVSKDLCDDGRMGEESRDAAVGFITRSATSGALLVGAGTLTAIGLATAGSPLLIAGLGVAGLALLPPIVESTVKKVGSAAWNAISSYVSGLRTP